MARGYDLLYATAALLGSPVWGFNLLRTGKWRTDWRGRFGKREALPGDPRPTVLIHGVSVGEINATRELVRHLTREDAPPVRPVVSATTNTGIERARQLYGSDHTVVRFPFDFSWMVRRFLDAVSPDLIVLVELEVWPNLSQECRRREIPLCVINGRLSDSSYRNYRLVAPLVRPIFRNLAAAAAQTEVYAERFADLGVPAERVSVTDNMKWDTVRMAESVPGAEELAVAMGIDRSKPLVVAGSTGPGEEERLIATRPPGVQLLVVPRKPERFESVARLVGFVRRTEHPDGPGRAVDGAELFLLDTMGELAKAYSLADVAIVGRSFAARGGSDPIEPISLGKPTVIGPHHKNFSDVVTAFREADGITVSDTPMAAAADLLRDPERASEMAERGRNVIRARQGASERHAELVYRLLGSEPGGVPA
ncbi:MAG: 3-deoxy-D-manno-octulosonic acid transferase [Gemmatimonadota bacterium]|nr:MAG: 3-deoxy-D-manno-octulosonic acid transferase [Gemmatimonadota bacterium]